jgi:hypothetical protein
MRILKKQNTHLVFLPDAPLLALCRGKVGIKFIKSHLFVTVTMLALTGGLLCFLREVTFGN